MEVSDPKHLDPLPSGFDLVAISSLSAQIKDAYRIAERYRAAGVPVVMGGCTSRPGRRRRRSTAPPR